MEASSSFRYHFYYLISKFTLLGIFLVVNFFLIVGIATPVEAATAGEGIFQQRWASCHTIGGGAKVGPDLQGVTDRREKAWLVSYVSEAANVKAKKDPIAVELAKNWKTVMPNTGISKDEAAAVITYLGNQTGVGSTISTQTQPPIVGDAVLGRNLYVGAVTFKNGGGACIACHNAGGTGTFGGGILGPDLTNTFATYGKAGLSSVLSTSPLPFPTMKPIYDSQPITPEEAAHLTAYFAANVTQQAPQGGNQFVLYGLGGTLLLLVLSGLFGRKRIKSVRRTLIEESYKSKN